MTNLVRAAATVAIAAVLILAGCSTNTDTDSGGYDRSPGHTQTHTATEPGTAPAGAAGAALAVAGSALGDIVVDGRGMTVYIFDSDTPGSGVSSCTGQCLVEWPPVTTDTPNPQVTGVSGQIGTIPGPNGTMQVTVNGWPIYYFDDDAAPGDVQGQGDDGVWWVLDAAGHKVTTQK